jgi:ABC-type nitrate/sulfonate/bicarbonate transport system substrate-binding protein
MVANLKAGNLDSYCVGEPWNSQAIHRGLGWCVATSAELAPGHPEKVLVTGRQFADQRSPEHIALIAALLKACAYCDRIENEDHVVKTLARPAYLNLPVELIRPSFGKTFDFGCGRIAAVTDFQIFHRHDANTPSSKKASWILRSILQNGLGPDRSSIDNDAARHVF